MPPDMQIQIPVLDQDHGPPLALPPRPPAAAFAPRSPVHRRDESSSSVHHPFAPFFMPSFGSSGQAPSRPFGGQGPPVLPSSAAHDHQLRLRRKASATAPVLRSSPSSPSLNTSIQAHIPLTRAALPRKLSVASLKSAAPPKPSHPVDNPRAWRANLDWLGGSMALNSSSPLPWAPNPGPMAGAAGNLKDSRGRAITSTTGTMNSASSGHVEVHGPLEVAIYLIMDRFFEECETKLGLLLGKPISTNAEDDPCIASLLGPGVDPGFDATFESLAQVSKKGPGQVVNFLMRWKCKHGDGVDDYFIQRALSASAAMTPSRAASALAERKGIALVYLLCRGLLAIVKGVTREALGEELGSRLEDIVFNSIKNADPLSTSRSPNKQVNMQMFALLLGTLSDIRFASVSDRFAAEIDLMNRGVLVRDHKEGEARLGYLIRGVQFLKLKVYPPEAFEETTDFISSFASLFDASRGFFVKTAMVETLGPLLAQVVQSATAELNHPIWAKAIVLILNKAHSMCDKPSKARYWNSTVPLICAALGTAPQDVLLARWSETVDWCMSRLKEKSTRSTMILGMVQLVWAYLHRVREGVSALHKRMEPILRLAFPPDRTGVHPPGVSLEIFASLIHSLLHWQLDYGSECVLRTLLSAPHDISESNPSLVSRAGPERITIAVSASLRALTSLEKAEDPPYPTLEVLQGSKSVVVVGPSSGSGSPLGSSNIDTSDGHVLKPETLEKPRINAFVNALGTKVLQVAAYCDRTLAPFTLTDEKYILPWNDSLLPRVEASDGPTIFQRHGAFAVEYPRSLQPTFEALQTCVHAWPRLLTTSTSESAALGILFRGLISLDVGITVESKRCLQRFLSAGKAFEVLQGFTRFLAKPEFFFRLQPYSQKGLDSKVEGLVKFWVEVLSAWCEQLRKTASAKRAEDISMPTPGFGSEGFRLACHTEATGLVLLCHRSPHIRRSALDALRIIATARTVIEAVEPAIIPDPSNATQNLSLASLLDQAESHFFQFINPDDLTSSEKSRFSKMKKQRQLLGGEGFTRLLESDNSTDNALHFFALSFIFSVALSGLPATMLHARSLLYCQLQRVYPLASEAAGIGVRAAGNGNTSNPGWDDRNLQWTWAALLIAVVSITTANDPKTFKPSVSIDPLSVGSQSSSSRERSISPGEDLIKTLVPFLTSDQAPFRESAIRALSCIHVSMYATLLEGVSGLTHHLTSERKMMEVQQDRSVGQPSGPIKTTRLYSAIGKLHESTTRFLFHPDFVLSERCADILLRFIRENCLFLRWRQAIEDQATSWIRKSFLILGERLLRKLGADWKLDSQFQTHQLFSPELLADIFSLAEDWSTRPLIVGAVSAPFHPAASTDSRPPRHNSLASRANISRKGRSSSAASLYPNPDLFAPAAAMVATLCETTLQVIKGNESHHRLEGTADRPTVSVGRILKWMLSLLEKADPKTHAEVRRAFIGSVRNAIDPDKFLEAAVALCWNDSDSLPLNQTLFGVLSNALLVDPQLKIQEVAILALCLSHMTHANLATRQRALDVLKLRGLLGTKLEWLTDIEANLTSTFSGQHSRAQLTTSTMVCSLQEIDPLDFATELGTRIVLMDLFKSKYLSRLLPTWLAHVHLVSPDTSSARCVKVRNLLTVMVLVSSRMGEPLPDEVRSIWQTLASAPFSNLGAIISYLLEQTRGRASPAFVRLARAILLCMTENGGMTVVTTQLLNAIEPARLTASNDAPSPLDCSQTIRPLDLDSYFPPSPTRTTVSTVQAAVLLLGEFMILYPAVLGDRLPHVLHAHLVQADHTNLSLRAQMRDGLVRFLGVLRRRPTLTLIPRGPPSSHDAPSREFWRGFWEFGDMGSSRRHRTSPPATLQALVQQIASWSSTLQPAFFSKWASVAMEWATQCPVRHVACRSLQVFKILGFSVDSCLWVELLVRLSNTVSDPSPDIQLFSLEVLTTFSAGVKFEPSNRAPLAQLFWTGIACLETANESEFLEGVSLLKAVIESADVGCFLEIETSRPLNLLGDGGPIRNLMMKGLRSSQTCQATWSLVKTFLSVRDCSRLVDWTNGAIGLLYAASLPWCLHILDTGFMQYEMDDISSKLAQLADSMDMDGLSRVMVSFYKKRFRTMDDFLRQAVNCLREYFLPAHGLDVLLVYLGLLFNPLEWVRARTLAVLKLVIRTIEPASPDIMALGYDLLTPLLNLLQSNLSQQALDVLAELMPVKSQAFNPSKGSVDDRLTRKVFGRPDETGWCVADQQQAMQLTRALLTGVVDKFAATSCASEPLKRPSVVEFTQDWGHEPDNSADARTQSDLAETNESFGEMVSTLHDLSDFFGQDGACAGGSKITSSLNPSTARVAAILSRSLSKRRANRPSLHFDRSSNSPGPLQTPTLRSCGSRPLSMTSSYPSTLHSQSTGRRCPHSMSLDSRDEDIYEEEEPEYEDEDEEAGVGLGRGGTETGGGGGDRGSPTGTYCTDDSQSVFVFDLDDEHHNRHSRGIAHSPFSSQSDMVQTRLRAQ